MTGLSLKSIAEAVQYTLENKNVKKDRQETANERFQDILAFPETGKAPPFNNKGYKVNVSIG